MLQILNAIHAMHHGMIFMCEEIRVETLSLSIKMKEIVNVGKFGIEFFQLRNNILFDF